MDEVAELFRKQRYDESLARAQAGKAELLALEKPDPLLLGWFHFYELKNLYALGRTEEAFDLVDKPVPRIMALSVNNGAWMYSVGAEMAMRLSRADDIVRFGRRCLEYRLQRKVEDPISLVQCCSTMCNLLGAVEREDLNREFAEMFLQLAREMGATQGIERGEEFLAANAARTKARAAHA